MNLKPPPHFVMVPSGALFRQDRLPPELLETWLILRAITWLTGYRATPPLSLADLLELHGAIVQQRTLVERLDKLQALGWLTVQRRSGTTNVYRPIVPQVTPLGAPAGPVQHQIPDPAVSSGTSSSDAALASAGPSDPLSIATDSPECSTGDGAGSAPLGAAAFCEPAHDGPVASDPASESGRLRQTPGADVSEPALAVDRASAVDREHRDIVVAVAVNSLSFKEQKNKTTTATAIEKSEEQWRIEDALADLDLSDPGAIQEVLGFAWVTPEYLEDWVKYRRRCAQKYRRLADLRDRYEYTLFGGYFRVQIRRRRTSPDCMTRDERERYRRDKDQEWEERETERRLEEDSASPLIPSTPRRTQ